MKPSEILRNAAKIVHSGLSKSIYERDGCCGAIEDTSDKEYRRIEKLITTARKVYAENMSKENGEKLTKLEDAQFDLQTSVNQAGNWFSSLFRPTDSFGTYWFNSYKFADGYRKEDFCKKNQEHRIIALLITADIAESEGF